MNTDPGAVTRTVAEIGADLDEAIAQFRKAMPDCGLKLIVPPPLPDGKIGRLSVSAWRRGQPSAPVHSGSSAREAIQQLFCAADQADRELRRRSCCRHCGGIGWYVAENGIKAICNHP
ncbi:MAG TPA: hypothetical protein VKR31_09005 [Rhizomicrobium sp.]|nr:hypothetical protein [Rhizomicrobium sp.]